jgi:hypothetical protein
MLQGPSSKRPSRLRISTRTSSRAPGSRCWCSSGAARAGPRATTRPPRTSSSPATPPRPSRSCASNARWTPASVGVWGVGQGALLAPMVAARAPEVRFLMVVSAPGLPPGENAAHRDSSLLAAKGFDAADIKRTVSLDRRLQKWLRDGEDRASLKHCWWRRPPRRGSRRVRSRSGYPRALCPPAGIGRGARWIPATAWGAVKVPVLALYGAADELLPAKTNARAVERALRNGREQGRHREDVPGRELLRRVRCPERPGTPWEWPRAASDTWSSSTGWMTGARPRPGGIERSGPEPRRGSSEFSVRRWHAAPRSSARVQASSEAVTPSTASPEITPSTSRQDSCRRSARGSRRAAGSNGTVAQQQLAAGALGGLEAARFQRPLPADAESRDSASRRSRSARAHASLPRPAGAPTDSPWARRAPLGVPRRTRPSPRRRVHAPA